MIAPASVDVHEWWSSEVVLVAPDGREAVLGCVLHADVGCTPRDDGWTLRLERPFSRDLAPLHRLLREDRPARVRFYFSRDTPRAHVLDVDMREVVRHGIGPSTAPLAAGRGPVVADYVVLSVSAPQEVHP